MFWTQLFMFQLNYTSIHPQHQGTEVAGSTRWGYTCIPEVQVPPSCNQENTGSGPPSQQAQRTLFPRCSCNCVEVSAAGGSLWRQRTGMKPFPDVNYLQERGVYWITVRYREDLFRIIAKKMACVKPWQVGWLSHVPSAWQTASIVSVSGYRIWNPSWQLIMRLSPGLYFLFVT